jgi:bifunctional ADP-heptose synthase (sugar kinase/adenylyltransferase)
MKRALVIGDTIIDEYIFGHATRLCPEGPVPVIIPHSHKETSGGMGLVHEQLAALMGPRSWENQIHFLSGSLSKKQRIFADDRLICRIDRDQPPSSNVADSENWVYKEVIPHIPKYDLLIISDYGKGAFTKESARMIQDAAKMPILADAKNNFDWYSSVFAVFPNEFERVDLPIKDLPHIIRKLGPRGCSVDGQIIPLEQEHNVMDVTGAGDVFLAAFAADMIRQMNYGFSAEEINLSTCARFANRVAARSVEFVGTYVVTDVKI